ncbi:hypothetical protein [Alloacidobacterium sp.]|uniref:hypothetical protein n=1 Tax=Alloacidobacterium sp. TaxID=2951999 RepID=UPI002D52EB53|nr:hypothetical protein [Alloacidobacterium sp.]HYK38282.1 hypothetical protein [Alloacidobacterium sp.]
MLKIIPLLLGTVLAAQAQQVTLVNSSMKQFSGSDGVTFRYPAIWNFSTENEFYSPSSITAPYRSPQAVVFFKDAGEFNPYPETTLNGAEFVYAQDKAATAEICPALTPRGDANAHSLEPTTINGIKYKHVQLESAGMCHQIREDVYATYRNQTCYLFDLAIHTICSGVKDNTRDITPDELSQVHASLEKILSSIEISDLKKN